MKLYVNFASPRQSWYAVIMSFPFLKYCYRYNKAKLFFVAFNKVRAFVISNIFLILCDEQFNRLVSQAWILIGDVQVFPRRNAASRPTVKSLLEKFRKTESVWDKRKGPSGRPRSTRTYNNIETLRQHWQNHQGNQQDIARIKHVKILVSLIRRALPSVTNVLLISLVILPKVVSESQCCSPS